MSEQVVAKMSEGCEVHAGSAKPTPEAVAALKAVYPPALFQELTAAFVSELKDERDLTDFTHSYLLEFKRQGLPAGYSKALLTALTRAHPQVSITQLSKVLQCDRLLTLVCTDFPRIDAVSFLVKSILAVEVRKAKETDPAALLAFPLSMWRSGHRQEAARFALVFELEEEFLQQTNAFPELVAHGHSDLAVSLAGHNRARVTALIPLLTAKDDLKVAGRLIRELELEHSLFPEVCAAIKRNGVWYYVNSGEVEMWRFAEILEEDMEMLGIFIDTILVTRQNLSVRQLACSLLARFPALRSRLRGKARDVVRLTPPATAPLRPEDAFAPSDPAALQYPLSPDTVVMVDCEEQLRSVDLEAGDVVGFDCEWLPPLISINSSPVSIFQIATRSRTYILDMHRLKDSGTLDSKLTSLFANPHIVKVGMSFDGDYSKLKKSCPSFGCFQVHSTQSAIQSFADLHKLQKHFPEASSGGLAHIVKCLVGQPLCKGEQVSNWNKRPLRLRQMHYAALDAYSEVMVWDRMVQRWAEKQPPLYSLLSDLPSKSAKKRSSE